MPQLIPFFFINQIIFVEILVSINTLNNLAAYTSRYPWLTPQFYSDILRSLFESYYESLE